MSTNNIIQEALKDVNALVDSAEHIAQRKIMNVLSPKIRRVVESRLLNEEELDLDSVLQDIESTIEDDIDEEPTFDDEFEASVGLDDTIKLEPSTVQVSSTPEEDPSVVVHAAGDVEIEIEKEESDSDDEEVITGAQVIETRVKIRRLAKRVDECKRYAKRNLNDAQKAKLHRYVINLSEAAVNFLDNPILSNDFGMQSTLQEAFTSVKQIQERLENNMKRRSLFEKRHCEVDEMDEMEETDEMEELDELDAVLSLVLDDEDAEAAEDLGLDDLDIEVQLDSDEDEDSDEGSDDEEIELDFDDMDVDMDEEGDDEVLELDESQLRKAVMSMRRQRRRRISEDAADAADSFGGGDAEGDMFIDVDEDTLVNALADELGRVSSVGTAAPAVAESRRRRRRRRRVSESSRRRSRRQQGRSTGRRIQNENRQLKRRLAESNLFNAKLIYVNRLFEGRNVSKKQRRRIVEAMDNAKTLRDAKLLYRSITQALNKNKSGRLSEGKVRLAGSASRTTSSAQPAQNGVEIQRWHTLAGLTEDK